MANTDNTSNSNGFPITQIALEGLREAIDEVYTNVEPIIKAIATIKEFKTSIKSLASKEGFKIGDVLKSFDETLVLEGSSSSKARLSKQGLIDLGEVGMKAVGAWELAHQDDEKTLVLKIMDKRAHEIELDEIIKYVELIARCKQLAQEAQATPEVDA